MGEAVGCAWDAASGISPTVDCGTQVLKESEIWGEHDSTER